MRLSHSSRGGLVALFLLGLFASASAKEAYFNVSVESLKLKMPATAAATTAPADEPGWARDYASWPRVLLDGAGEAYAATKHDGGNMSTEAPPLAELEIRATAPEGQPLKGRILVPQIGADAMDIPFEIPAASADDAARKPFLVAKARYCQRLLIDQVAGNAWYRHEMHDLMHAMGKDSDPTFESTGGRVQPDNFDETFSLFSGGRAVSENLQLDRAMRATTNHSEEMVKIDTLLGVEVKSIDWKPLLKDAKPQTDPLAVLIPIDQPVIFFPSIKQAAAVLELAEKNSTPVIQADDPQAQDAMTRERYETQLCHSVADLQGLADGGLIDSVAVTASDPYARVGTDLAIVMQSKNAHELHDRIAKKIAESKGGTAASGDVDGLAYSGSVSPLREVSAYVAELDGSVLLTNSLAQVRHFAAVKKASVQAIATAPEYTFFRNRYVLGQEEESGFLVLSDASIRKWCSPRWRIADSRRTRVAGVLLDLTAQNMEVLAKGDAVEKVLDAKLPTGGGEAKLTSAGVASSVYGTLGFMTPIAEIELTEATKSEADAYNRWRIGYQHDWSWAFDPIALRISAADERLRGDVTVMPLIDFSEYKDFIAMSRGATIKPGSGDPHDALLHWAFALNVDSKPMKDYAGAISMFMPNLKIKPFEWVGQTVAVYADDGPFWKEIAAAKDPEDYFEHNLAKLPVAIQVDVRDGLRATMFLAGVHGFVDSSAPGMVKWLPQEYHGRAYVSISATAEGRKNVGDGMPEFSIYYAISGDGLVVTVNEDLIKRVIDRQIARQAATSQPDVAAKLPATRPWLGQNLAMQLNAGAVNVLRSFSSEYKSETQALSWMNLPILNELKRMYPDRDPLAVYQQVWHERLIDPAGGSYVWSEKWQTMESSVYGCPEAPKAGPDLPGLIERLRDGNFGVDFEEHGVQGRADVGLGK